MDLGSLTWPDLEGTAAGLVLLVPIGSTEQHGPHLPLSTDTDIARSVAEGAASERSRAIVAPALPFGSSGEHAGFPGTVSIGQTALELVAVELVRSADAFGAVVFVCGHGGNLEALRRAEATLVAEGRRALVWHPTRSVDAHAGRTETSLMLAIDPTAVRLDRAVPGDTRPLAELLPTLRAGGVRAVADTGVLGDPTGASVAEGRAHLEGLVADLVAALDRLAVDA